MVRWLAMTALASVPLAQAADDRRNVFDDPFIQITAALPNCPVPAGPLYSAEQVRAEAHDRAQRGTSCHLAGRCRLANAYLYDKEIIPRVAIAVRADGRYRDSTSLWAVGQRRWVWLQGCVGTAEQARALEAMVRLIDDVDGVTNQLSVGTSAAPAYEVAAPAAKP
ncbi:MAG: BON domain-containing protein [Burkholderiales bacterium]|nr:BON domain-containing protein [Burkholderiales bacterium]